MKRIRLLLATLAVFVGLGAAVPVMAFAATTPEATVCTTLGSDADCNKTPAGSVSLNTVIKVLINILSILVGVVAVVMIIVGGFRYVTSGGDSGKITSAKNTIVYAVVGLIVVALAQFIVWFVLNRLK